jgi:hypothetical protein
MPCFGFYLELQPNDNCIGLAMQGLDRLATFKRRTRSIEPALIGLPGGPARIASAGGATIALKVALVMTPKL